MSDQEEKADLLRYLRQAREVLVWKLDGLTEYDIRRPMTSTGTNLLGLVKHVASVELGYFGEAFGRSWPEPIPWFAEGAAPNADMWAAPDESREDIVSFYRRTWSHSDATIETLPLDAVGRVPWWPKENQEVTLHAVLVRMVGETNRHAGHADIIRELIDESAGYRSDSDNLPPGDADWWRGYREKLEAAARAAGFARPGTAVW